MHPSTAKYQMRSQVMGWSRIDMLLALYDKTINTIRQADESLKKNEQSTFFAKSLEIQNCILVIHSGLRPDESITAFNHARLLLFVADCITAQKFDDAIRILESMRSGFETIREEATRLENEGFIPPLEFSSNLDSIA